MQWFKTRIKGGRTEVFDPVRRKYVILTPEEEVRQIILHTLVTEHQMPAGLIAVEYALRLNGLDKRCDIVVFSTDSNPIMIVECKAQHIPITQTVLDQVSRYNLKLGVRFLLITNGKTHYSIKIGKEGQLEFLDCIPDYSILLQQ
ncbi:MAG: type I restriction enzyme HsdR N-terminal domain-containing protein [Ignavibacteria bacterium]|nr:type I restriction enzyme HsdR N-terminal domain-containing protein [Ignavibacteria bacterium]